MSSKGKKSKESTEGILESSEALQEQFSRTEQFIMNNKGLVSIAFTLLLITAAGFIGYRYYQNSQNNEAQAEMFQAVYYFEQDSLEKALLGDGNNLGFSDIVDQYGHTEAGNLANFYGGYIYLTQGKYDLALMYLEDFSSNDLIMQARAYSLIGDVYMEQSNFKEAVAHYKKAANTEANEFFTPVYLKKAAIAYENLQDLENAKNAYLQIVNEFKNSQEYNDARKHYYRLGGTEL